MMIAIPEQEWVIFSTMNVAQIASVLLQLANNVRLRAFRKHPRGPKNLNQNDITIQSNHMSQLLS